MGTVRDTNQLTKFCVKLVGFSVNFTLNIVFFYYFFLGPSHQPGVRDHPEAAVYNKNFKGKKEELTRRLFKLFNREVFEGRVSIDHCAVSVILLCVALSLYCFIPASARHGA